MDQDPKGTPPLQFETAVPRVVPTEARPGVTCVACQRTIGDQYFDINGQTVCESCRQVVEQSAETPKEWGTFVRTALFGVVAAILGAVLYYAVIAITNFEIGIVAIAIGYMVGYGVRRGAGGRGGRRFQVLAVVLTYWAVGLAYTPLVFKGARDEKEATRREAAAPAATPAPALADSTGVAEDISVTYALAVLLGFSLALPVLAVISSLPSGLISGAIIAFGMQQAWRMTAAPQLQISGPYRIAAPQASP